MRIVYAALKYDYGRPEQGCSFEHYNFYDSLVRMGHDILYFDVGSIGQHSTKEVANKRLVEIVKAERPEAFFAVLFRDELDEHSVREISETSSTTSIAWFSDDHWRFDSYSRIRAPWFNWSVTTSNEAFQKYKALGYSSVIKSQWACNTHLYKPLDIPTRFPVSFVGLPHGNRRFVMQALRDAGIEVATFGKGWDAGRVTQEQMIRIFNESAINLNLANASAAKSTVRRVLNLALHAVAISPLPKPARRASVRAFSVADSYLPGRKQHYPEQIKGRNFEVPGCGAFLLTAMAHDLERFYRPGSEVAAFTTTEDLIAQVRRFLAQPDLRAAIASAGYARTLADHTYTHRFASIFEAAGLASPPPEAILSGKVAPGRTDEVI